MKEEDKNIKQAFEGFEKFLQINMIKIRFNSLIKEWTEEIEEHFRNQVINLPDYIGKPVNIICQLKPTLEIHLSKGKSPETAVLWETEEIEMYIFKNNICTDAYQIPNNKIGEVMTDELREKFFRLSDTVIELYKWADK